MTQKEELATLQAENIDLKNQLDAKKGLDSQLAEAQTNLTAAEKARDDEKARADKAESDLQTATARADKAEADLNTANDQLATACTNLTAAEKARDDEKIRADKAEKDVANADQRHAERLASRNVSPVQTAATPGAGDSKPAKVTANEIKAQYEAIEDKNERFAFYQKNKAVLLG